MENRRDRSFVNVSVYIRQMQRKTWFSHARAPAFTTKSQTSTPGVIRSSENSEHHDTPCFVAGSNHIIRSFMW